MVEKGNESVECRLVGMVADLPSEIGATYQLRCA